MKTEKLMRKQLQADSNNNHHKIQTPLFIMTSYHHECLKRKTIK